MKNLIQRVRDWMIKRLGGYTEAEYCKALHPPFRDELVPIKRKSIHRITSTLEVSRAQIGFRGFPSERFIREKLQLQLSSLIGDYMQFMQREDKFQLDSVAFEGVIYVLRED